jgi:hypothetical protein
VSRGRIPGFLACYRLPVNYSSVNSIKPASARCPWRKISRVLGRAPDCSVLLNLASWRQIAPGDSNVGSASSWLGGGSPLEQHRIDLLRFSGSIISENSVRTALFSINADFRHYPFFTAFRLTKDRATYRQDGPTPILSSSPCVKFMLPFLDICFRF